MILLLISCTHLGGLVRAFNPSHIAGPQTPPPQVPSLIQLQSIGDTLVFLCQAPKGHRGVHFELYGNKTLCHTVKHQTEECSAVLTVTRQDVTREKPFCCLYKDALNKPSAFSSYVYAKLDEEVGPFPPPALVSSSGEVQRGQTLTLTCSLPECLRPKAVLLLRQSPEGHRSLRRPSSVVSSSRDSTFRVVPADGAHYSCLYQMSLPSGVSINSSISKTIQVNVSQHQNKASEPPTTDLLDWPLILGAISAAALFLAIVIGLGVAVHKKVQDAAKEKKMREAATFWIKVHGNDDIVDRPVRPLSICSKDSGATVSEHYARPKTLSTFANPSFC